VHVAKVLIPAVTVGEEPLKRPELISRLKTSSQKYYSTVNRIASRVTLGHCVSPKLLSTRQDRTCDTGLLVARRWLDQENVDAIVDVPSSPLALALQPIVREKNGVMSVCV